MHFTLHQLSIFLKVSELQSITKAANALHLSQPAVSLQVKKLQEQFELPLTEVVGRQLFITDFGKEIAKRSERILQESEAIRYTIDQYKGILTGKIKISVVSTGKYLIPYLLRDFFRKYPGVDISIDVSNKLRVVEGIQQNTQDFSLVSVLPEQLPLHTLELLENKLILVGSKAAERKIRSIKDLSKCTLIFRESGSATRNAMQEYLEKNNIPVSNSIELVSNEAVKQAVSAGLGFSIMPLIGLRSALATKSLQIVPLKGLPITTQWNLVYNKDKALTPAQQALIDFLTTNKSQIINTHFSWVKDYTA